ncbi:MAG: ABC transporter substrate-binding protein [Clostridiales bacterium]|jgi:simple sugar transport system substrate-binding protein|nr:ABC transporter substrate-binding protein [Clostridiales bacterium]
MKKLVTAVLLAAMLLSLAACATPQTTDGGSDGGTITVGFAQCKADESDWRKANTISMQEALSAENGYNMILADANNDAAKQVADVQGFIDQEVDYIVIAAVNMDGWDTVLKNAQDAGIPVILVDRTVNASEDLYTCWVGSGFKEEGVKATDWLASHFGDAEVNIVNLQGQLGSSAQVGRSEALVEAVEANDNWTLLEQQTADWSTDTAKEIMTTWIQQHDNINCVYAENDNMADGAIQALQEAGIEVGGDNGVAIISFDANRAYLEMTLAGLINCNVECNPLHGPKVAEIIQMLENGEQPAKSEVVEESAFFYNTITQEIIDARAY